MVTSMKSSTNKTKTTGRYPKHLKTGRNTIRYNSRFQIHRARDNPENKSKESGNGHTQDIQDNDMTFCKSGETGNTKIYKSLG